MYRVGLISNAMGWDDLGLNDNAKYGLEYAAAYYSNIIPEYKESLTPADQIENLNALLEDSCNLIIVIGGAMDSVIFAAADANPETDFLLIDSPADSTLKNYQNIVFDVEEVAFPGGYLAAWYADRSDSIAPVAGWVGDTIHQRQVESSGVYTSRLSDYEDGAAAADSLIEGTSADILFVFAGTDGSLGALEKVAENEKAAIGACTDRYYTYTDIREIFLSSCIKRYDYAVADIVIEYSGGLFRGNRTAHYTISNQGVWMAGYHDLLDIVPDSVTDNINRIFQYIMYNEIDPLEWGE